MIGPHEIKIIKLVCKGCDCVINKDLEDTPLFKARRVRYCSHAGLKPHAQVACIIGYPSTPKWCPAIRNNTNVSEASSVLWFDYYLNEKFSKICVCREPKERGQPFCDGCLNLLPDRLIGPLENLIGEGYEEAFEQAFDYLDIASDILNTRGLKK